MLQRVVTREKVIRMYYVNQIRDLLMCSQNYAQNIYDYMSYLDLSEMSQEMFELEVAIATNFVEANDGDL